MRNQRPRDPRRWVVAAGLAAALASSASAAELPRVTDLRIGNHLSFDRIVLQLDGPAETHVSETGGRVELFVAADPFEARSTLRLAGSPVGAIEIRREEGGLLLGSEPAGQLVRVFTLVGPNRVVIDFGDPELAPFAIPEGAVPVVAGPAPPEVAEAPTPEPAPEPLPALEPEPGPPVEILEDPTPPVGEATLPEPEAAPEVSELSKPEPAPPVSPPVAPREAAAEKPRVEIEGGPEAWLILLGVAVGIAAISAAVYWRRRRAAQAAPAARPDADVGPETITQAELEGGPRAEVLEKRLDEEVRARMNLEEKMGALLEEQKVLRDRLHRMTRRRESETG